MLFNENGFFSKLLWENNAILFQRSPWAQPLLT